MSNRKKDVVWDSNVTSQGSSPENTRYYSTLPDSLSWVPGKGPIRVNDVFNVVPYPIRAEGTKLVMLPTRPDLAGVLLGEFTELPEWISALPHRTPNPPPETRGALRAVG